MGGRWGNVKVGGEIGVKVELLRRGSNVEKLASLSRRRLSATLT